MRFPEPWSSTSLANQAALTRRPGRLCLDRAFALIEGHRTILSGSCGALRRLADEGVRPYVFLTRLKHVGHHAGTRLITLVTKVRLRIPKMCAKIKVERRR